jgi:hypothetical protein
MTHELFRLIEGSAIHESQNNLRVVSSSLQMRLNCFQFRMNPFYHLTRATDMYK